MNKQTDIWPQPGSLSWSCNFPARIQIPQIQTFITYLDQHPGIAMLGQALVAIVAIVAVAIVVMQQARAQHQAALALREHERMLAHRTLAGAVDAIAGEVADSVKFAVRELNSQQNVYDVANGIRYFRRHSILIHEQSLQQVPLYQLTSPNLIKLIINLTSITAQVHYTIESVLQVRELLSLEEFTGFFNQIDQMASSADDIARAIHTETNGPRI